jgi:hypothetical protein
MDGKRIRSVSLCPNLIHLNLLREAGWSRGSQKVFPRAWLVRGRPGNKENPIGLMHRRHWSSFVSSLRAIRELVGMLTSIIPSGTKDTFSP